MKKKTPLYSHLSAQMGEQCQDGIDNSILRLLKVLVLTKVLHHEPMFHFDLFL
jgi:hypothetical protein